MSLVQNHDPDTDEFILRIRSGDDSAISCLLDRHRPRLKRLVDVRMDDRIRARVDPSDVVQEVLTQATCELSRYLVERPIPFYPWLRQIAWKQLTQLYRMHVIAECRSVAREVALEAALSDQSANVLAEMLVAPEALPSEQAIRVEAIQRMQVAIAQLTASHREVLILRHLEGLSVAETATVLNVTESAVTARHFRALSRLRELLHVGSKERS